MDCKQVDIILETIAKSHHTTVGEVRREILFVMEEAQESQDPLVQARWAMIPHAGAKPSIEEFITYLATRNMS